MGAKRAFAAAAAGIVSAAAALSLFGCGPSPEEAVREDLTAKLERIKTLDGEFVSENASDPALAALSDRFGVDAGEFLRVYLEGFSYSVDDVEESDGTVSATVTLTCKSRGAFAEALTAASEEFSAGTDASSMDGASLDREMGRMALTAAASAPTVQMAPLTLAYTREDGNWVPAADAEAKLREAIAAS